MSIRLSICGCALMDYLYTNVDFNAPAFKRYQSEKDGDGGISPGKLVFTSDLEKYANRPCKLIVEEIVGKRSPTETNVGGPGVVAAIHAAQLSSNKDVDVLFYGVRGDDETGVQIYNVLSKTPLNIEHYFAVEGRSPTTIVLSDPEYRGGEGERAFINTIGAAWNYKPEDIGIDFFSSDIVLFGGTALVPRIHAGLYGLLKKAKDRSSFTVVSTVYDFLNQQRKPEEPWPLGEDGNSYPLVDLLIVDREEALRLSDASSQEEALDRFRSKGVKAIIITNGAEDVLLSASSPLFNPIGHKTMPISQAVREELRRFPEKRGDTTGCGDNFVGGVLASLSEQLTSSAANEKLDIEEACSLGIVSGGYACYYAGGTYLESCEGEKAEHIKPYLEAYKQQLREN